MVTSEIKISTILPPTLDTREAATRLVKVIKEESKNLNKLEIDFSGIIFMSRSFADQFHKDLYTSEQSLDMVFKNASLDIIEMLRAVSNTQTKRKAFKKTYQVFSFNTISQLEDISFSW